MKSFALSMISVLLAACGAKPHVAGSEERSKECDPEAAGWAIGQKLSDELISKATKSAGANHVWVLKPNHPTTMDYRNDRLGLQVNDQNVIVSIRCG